MSIGSPNLTASAPEAAATQPGMAYFADTGPFGATCGGCLFKGYTKLSSRETFNASTDEWYRKSYRVSGCRKFYELSGRHGPNIDATNHACKYFEERTAKQQPKSPDV